MLTERKLMYDTGTEGPQFDPYSYKELTVRQNGQNITLHLGLCVYVKDNNKILAHEEEAENIFEQLTGFTPDLFEKSYDKIKYTCNKCGNRRFFEPVSGHPGETLLLCCNCNNIVYSYVNLDAII